MFALCCSFSEGSDQSFRAPPVLSYPQYLDFIERELFVDSTVAFGLHPNAEIGIKTEQVRSLLLPSIMRPFSLLLLLR